jgi:cobalt-zinc-cadmium efflux system membrane fusion protein
VAIGHFIFVAGMILEAEEMEIEEARGTHGGRLLTESDFTVELSIFEEGVLPEYRAWAYLNDEPIDNRQWQLEVNLTRLGGRIDEFDFAPMSDYLLGNGVVEEPHSFDVSVVATYGNRSYSWQYESHEGRTYLSNEMLLALGISVQEAGAGEVHQTEVLYGKISADPRQISHITARYSGIIQSVIPALGDSVAQGDLIATVEANDSLRSYEIRAPISGLVVDSHANPGEHAGGQTLLTIADYRNVWADLNVFPSSAQTIQAGQSVEIKLGTLTTTSSIRYLNPGEGLSPNVVARVPVENSELVWTPGLLIEAEVTIERLQLPLVIDNRALQDFRDWRVVFIQVGNEFEIRPLELGRTDGRFSEVLSGLNVGERYVVQNSYLIKADLEKSGASHDH